jgi:hypothetical protein
MSLRGRPRKNGTQPPSALFRALLGLYGYDKARMAGEKYEEGLRAAIEEVHRVFPDMPMSATEMKRILAEFRCKSLLSTLYLTKRDNLVTLDGKTPGMAWAIHIGPQPDYPRHNARED